MITKISSKLALIVFLAGCTQKKVDRLDISDDTGIKVDAKHSRSDTSKPISKQPVRPVKKIWQKKQVPSNKTTIPAGTVITTEIKGDTVTNTIAAPSINIQQQTIQTPTALQAKPVVQPQPIDQVPAQPVQAITQVAQQPVALVQPAQVVAQPEPSSHTTTVHTTEPVAIVATAQPPVLA